MLALKWTPSDRVYYGQDVVVIPKSTHKERMIENINVFNFELTDADKDAIKTLDDEEGAFFSHYDPATVELITGLGK